MSESRFEGSHPDQEWLSAWHDGELRDEAAESVRTHLAECAECRALLAEMGALDRAALEAAPGYPHGSDWDEIEGRLRQRLEDELGLGIPTEWSERYVAAQKEDVVLLPTPSPSSVRPFRLRWAIATAAGLALIIFSMRSFTDRMKLAIPGATRPMLETKEVQRQASGVLLDKDARIAPGDSIGESELYAAGVRAFDSGRYDAAAQSFALAATSLPDSALARDAEFREQWALARKRIAAGENPSAVAEGVARDAGTLLAEALPAVAESGDERLKWGALRAEAPTRANTADQSIPQTSAPAGKAPPMAEPTLKMTSSTDLCRRALAMLRTAVRLAEETGRGEPVPDTKERIRQLERCAGASR